MAWASGASAQCSPDTEAPQLVVGPSPYTLVLDGSGQGSISLQDLQVNATDNCGVPTVTLSQNAYDCADVGTPASPVIVTAIDGAGNATSTQVTVIVVDQTAPQATGGLTASVVCASDVSGVPAPTADDNCESTTPASVTFVSQSQSGNVVSRVYQLSDGTNSVQVTQTITITDAQAPTLTVVPSSFPATQTIECDDAETMPTVTSSDNCATSPVIVSGVRTSTQGADPGQADFYNYTVTRTYTSTDAAGNSASVSFQIVVEDTEAPMFDGAGVPSPASTTLQTSASNPSGPCFATFALDLTGEVSDNCASDPYLTYGYDLVDVATSASLYNGSGLSVSENLPVGVYLVTYSATDPSGNTGSYVYRVTVTDNQAPVAICQASTVQVSVDQSGVAMIDPAQIDNGSYDACGGPVTLSVSPASFDCSDIGTTQTVTLTVTDAGGASNTCTTDVAIVDNSAPAVTCEQRLTRQITSANPTTTIVPSDLAAGAISSFDACGPLAAEVSRSASTGFGPSVTLGCADVGLNSVYLRVTDAAGNAATCVTQVTVEDNEDPVARCADISRNFTASGLYRLTATDISAMTSASSDNCGIVSRSASRTEFSCDDLDMARVVATGSDTVHVHLTVSDASGNTDRCTSIVTLTDVTDPNITCTDLSVELDAAGAATVGAAEFVSGTVYLQSERGDNVTSASFTLTQAYDLTFDYAVSSADADFEFYYTVNGARQTVSGNSYVVRGASTASGSISVSSLDIGDVLTWAVDDDYNGGFNSGQGGSVTISNVEFRPVGQASAPAIAVAPGDYTFNGAGNAFFADASDPCRVLTYRVRRAGSGDPFAAALSLTCADVTGTTPLAVEVRVSDASGNSSTCTPNLTVVDGGNPSVACIPSKTVFLNAAGTGSITAASYDNGASTDACGGPLTFYFVDANLQSLGATLSLDCSDIGTSDVIVAAEDASGNVGYCNPQLVVEDALGPNIANYADQTIDCSASTAPANTGQATATDNCGGAVSLTFSDTNAPGSMGPDCRTIVRRWLATDARGNTSVAFQRITVEDNDAPIFTNVTTDPGYIRPFITAECDTMLAVVPRIDDNCTANVSVGYTATDSRYVLTTGGMRVNQFTPAQAAYYDYTITRLWVATDDCGNSSQRSQTVDVDDTQAPVFASTTPDNLQIDTDQGSCEATVTFDLTGLISDACAPTANLTVSNGAQPGANGYIASGRYAVGAHTITYTASDPRGNTSTFDVDFVVVDNQAPRMSCFGPLTLGLDNTGIATLSPSQVDNGSSDNCAIASYTLSQSTFTCADIAASPVMVTLTVTDASGNANSCTVPVTVQDAAIPVFDLPLPMTAVSVDCADDISPASLGQPTFSTNCVSAAAAPFVDVVVSGAGNCRTIERTFTATNASTGMSTTWVQTITVSDNVRPTLAGLPAVRSRTDECTLGSFPVVTATDNCGTPVVTTSDFSTRGTDPTQSSFYNYDVTRTYVADDGCLTTSASYTIRVRDTRRPDDSNVSDVTLPTDANQCVATVNIDLAALISDCAPDQYLTFVNDADASYGIGNGANLITGVLPPGSYPVNYSATDPTGRTRSGSMTITVEDQQGPYANCDPLTAVMSGGQAVVNAIDLDDGSTDNCGTVASYTVNGQPSVTYTAPGTYQVVLTVTDDSGNSTDCPTQVTVVAPVTLTAATVTGASGSTVSYSILADNFANVSGVSGTVTIANPAIANFVAGTVTYNAAFGPNAATTFPVNVSNGQLTFAFASPTAVSLPNGSALFTLDVQVGGANGQSTPVTVSGSPTQLLAVVNVNGTQLTTIPTVSAGSVSVSGSTAPAPLVSGRVHLPGSTLGVALVDVNYSGSNAGSVTTAADGLYSYSAVQNGVTTIAPGKDFNYSNGADVFDLFVINQHILGDRTMLSTAEQRIAANASNDATVDILDLIYLQPVVLGGASSFPAPSWQFVLDGTTLTFDPQGVDVPTFQNTATFSPVTGNIKDVDFTAVKVGDVNGSANRLQRGNAEVRFRYDDVRMRAGEEYEVEFVTEAWSALAGYQFTLALDGAEFVSAATGDLSDMEASHFNLAAADRLTHFHVNADRIDYADATVAYRLVLRATRDGLLSEALALADDVTPTRAYDYGGAAGRVVLVSNAVSSAGAPSATGISLAQNRPNPFGAITHIAVQLPAGMPASFEVSDATGRRLVSRRLLGDSGEQLLEVTADELNGPGVYTYRVVTEHGTLTRSMLRAR